MPRLPRHLAALALTAAGLVGALAGCAAPGDPAAGADALSTYPPPALTPPAPVPAVEVTATPDPSPTATLPAPTPTVALPDLKMTCPGPFIDADPSGTLNDRFGYAINAVRPFTVRIDYGDGHTYRDDDKHLAAVFSHTYQGPGQYQVTATLTDPDGHTVQGTCTSTWSLTPIAPVPPAPLPPYPGPVGAFGLCNDGTVTESAGVQGACSDHGGLSDTYDSPGSSGGYGDTYDSAGTGGGYGGGWVSGYTRADGTWVNGYWRN